MRASVRGEDEDNHRHDEAKNPEERVDAPVQGSGVGIGFGRHGVGSEVRGQRSETDNCRAYVFVVRIQWRPAPAPPPAMCSARE